MDINLTRMRIYSDFMFIEKSKFNTCYLCLSNRGLSKGTPEWKAGLRDLIFLCMVWNNSWLEEMLEIFSVFLPEFQPAHKIKSHINSPSHGSYLCVRLSALLRLCVEQTGCSSDPALWQRFHCDTGIWRICAVSLPLRAAQDVCWWWSQEPLPGLWCSRGRNGKTK